ncbi:ThiJ/PfpI [Agrocybe pediades]|nr:ThiJ/PfpI [Agrocybe pediades]
MVNPVWSFGVLLLPGFQLLDMAGTIDYFQLHSFEYMNGTGLATPDIINNAPIINWHFIAQDMNPVNTSVGPPVPPTVTFETAPKLDYLLVPGSDPFVVLPSATTKFVQKTFHDPSLKGLLTVCTGSMVLAQTGILDNHKVCSNKMVLKYASEHGLINHNVTWIGDKRWNKDGKVWSAAGVTAGLDLAAGFLENWIAEDGRKLAQDLFEYHPNPRSPDRFASILAGIDVNKK